MIEDVEQIEKLGVRYRRAGRLPDPDDAVDG